MTFFRPVASRHWWNAFLLLGFACGWVFALPCSSSAQQPTARILHTAIWTGSEMIIWGGIGTTEQNTGARFHPVTGLWTPTTTNGAPQARRNHQAIWTGNRMIIYGGFGSSGNSLASGAAYDPVTDTWTPLPAGNPPGARHDFAMAWTGSELMLWGGGNYQAGVNQLLKTGARLADGSAAWTSIPLTDAPTARSARTAVWSGTELLVWGDRGLLPSQSFENLDTGARYSTANDVWTTISSNNAPEGRNQHSAIWTGNRLIVWGGNGTNSGGSMFLNSGGRYHPPDDTWEAVTTNNAPLARRQHTAVWTGNRMIIWGGDRGNGSPLTDGAAYDPSTDTWQTLPSAGGPAGRSDHTAIWTGYEMLVWGGSSSGSYLTNLGRYVPSLEVWNARPGITITAPADGIVLPLPALVAITATADDSDGTVDSVAFHANGLPLGTDFTAPYSANLVAPIPGDYAITAVATDNTGLMTTSSVVNLTVTLPNLPPSVAIASPETDTKIVANGFISVTADPSDLDGSISSVEFRDGLSIIGTVNASPWSLIWSNVALGPHALTALATDNLGASATSAVVNVEAVLVPQLGVFRDPNAWRIELTGGETGRVYRLDITTNFSHWQPWKTNTATNGNFTTLDTDPGDVRRFYRAVP